MIHYTPECRVMKLGLNFCRLPGGFRAIWAWYDFATHKATTYRLRLRWHMAPRILWSVERFSVIDNYLALNGFDLVSTEVLQDLKAAEDQVKRTNEPYAYIKPYAT
jgi:hypothetical protein